MSIFEKAIVILDGYRFNSNYQKQIKLVATRLICVDELRDIYYHADVVINNQPCLSRKNFFCEEHTKIYTGINFSLLRKEFIAISNKQNKSKTIDGQKTFFVCFGGSDPYNFSKKIVEFLLKEIKLCNVNLVLGDGYDHISDFKSNQVNIYKSLDAANLIRLIKKSDIAILPASTIMLEAFCVGIPVISGWYDDKQKKTLECLHEMGYILNTGDYRVNFNNRMLWSTLSKALAKTRYMPSVFEPSAKTFTMPCWLGSRRLLLSRKPLIPDLTTISNALMI